MYKIGRGLKIEQNFRKIVVKTQSYRKIKQVKITGNRASNLKTKKKLSSK